MNSPLKRSYDVVVVGAGPAGSAAALYAVAAGWDVLLADAAPVGRDKTCGDGLTPRAITQLARLGLADTVTSRYRNRGLKLHGYGGSVTAPWPNSPFGTVGSAMPRTQFDALLARTAAERGAELVDDAPVDNPTIVDGRITSLMVGDREVSARWVIVADGVRSPVGKQLGRRWHRGEVYGIAARAYAPSTRADEEWMHSHVELRDDAGELQPGYGWLFPLGDGRVNVGLGALSTTDRPARLNTKKVLRTYVQQQRDAFGLGEPSQVASALLPMGGAVSGVAGPNWALIGDAAAGVNPLNGEGIDYGMEMAGLVVELISDSEDLTRRWPETLREHYGEAFVLARSAARLLTYPRFLPAVGPLALRGPVGATLMPAAARLMANLITDEDRDLMARLWRAAGWSARRIRRDTPLWG
ncbi:geranylgeranyl reductase family protein [Corynebacterium uterequi]|uniref:Geranylgeranyl reductase family protein n=1 Tax=Corynebacterium uterequi TaxID=1072256 RepID=A0A0G3HAB9_9CORY|nr:geranylgeranyl reductase family protein [Corynebacterium uterequi]